MAGGEESVPAVQHARPAARPAGRHHGAPRARPAAPAWRREPGVADAEPLSESSRRTHNKPHPNAHTHTLNRYPLVGGCELTQTGITEQKLTKTESPRSSSPLFIFASVTKIKKGFPLCQHQVADNQLFFLFYCIYFMDDESRRSFFLLLFHNQSAFLEGTSKRRGRRKRKSQELHYTKIYIYFFFCFI